MSVEVTSHPPIPDGPSLVASGCGDSTSEDPGELQDARRTEGAPMCRGETPPPTEPSRFPGSTHTDTVPDSSAGCAPNSPTTGPTADRRRKTPSTCIESGEDQSPGRSHHLPGQGRVRCRGTDRGFSFPTDGSRASGCSGPASRNPSPRSSELLAELFQDHGRCRPRRGSRSGPGHRGRRVEAFRTPILMAHPPLASSGVPHRKRRPTSTDHAPASRAPQPPPAPAPARAHGAASPWAPRSGWP